MVANNAPARTHITRNFDGYGVNNNYRVRNRFGSPLGRGYNVRTNVPESNLRISDNLTPQYSRNPNLNTPRRTHSAVTETRTETKSHETKKQAPGSAAKVRTTEATEKLHRSSTEARKNAEQQISRTRASSEAKAKETKHTPQTVKTDNTVINRSTETLRTPQRSSNFVPHTREGAALNRVAPRHTYSNVERGIVRIRDTANEVLVNGYGLNNHVTPNPYRARHTGHRSLFRGYGFGNRYVRRNAGNAQYGSRGYVLNYNNGYDGVIRDCRFGNNCDYRHGYAHNYGHAYAMRSHARYPVHHRYSSGHAISNAVTRGTDVLRDGARHTGLFRSNNFSRFNRGYARNHYQSPMFGYGYNYESNIVNHPYGYGTAGHLTGQIVNVPYIPGAVAGS